MGRRRTYRRPRPMNDCAARYCQAQTRHDFCPKHWQMVPPEFRTSLQGGGLARRAALALAADHIAIKEGYCGEN